MRKKIQFCSRKKFGIRCNGNQIVHVTPKLQAQKVGIQVGWTIESINGKIIENDSLAVQSAIREAIKQAEFVSIDFSMTNLFYTESKAVTRRHNSLWKTEDGSLEINTIKEIKVFLSFFFNIPWWISPNEITDIVPLFFSFFTKISPELIFTIIAYCKMIPLINPWIEIFNHQRKVDISRPKISNVEAEKIGYMLSKNPKVKDLSMVNCKLGNIGAELLAKGLEQNSTLMRLNIFHNLISDIGIQAIALVLNVNSSLQRLNVRTNIIGDTGSEAISEMLSINKTLTTLDVRDNTTISVAGANMLYQSVIKSNTIKKFGGIKISEINGSDQNRDILSLSKKGLGDSEALVITKYLTCNPYLTALDLRHNPMISLKCSIDLANIIIKNLIMKDFSGIPITDLKENNPLLTEINLSSTGCSDIEAFVMGSLLITNSTVETIILQCNMISNAGVKSLAAALKVNTRLKRLDLDENRIGDSGAESLLEALEINDTLTILDLYDNMLTQRLKERLEIVKQNHPTLKWLII